MLCCYTNAGGIGIAWQNKIVGKCGVFVIGPDLDVVLNYVLWHMPLVLVQSGQRS